MKTARNPIKLTEAESGALTAQLNAKRDPFSFDPIYQAISEEDLALLKQDPTFIEEEHDFERE